MLIEKLSTLPESEIYQKKIKRRSEGKYFNAEQPKKFIMNWKRICCSQVHGISQYLELEAIEISGVHVDYVSIQYQNGDRISIPVDQVRCCPNTLQVMEKAPNQP